MTLSVGVDLGTGAVKTALFSIEDGKTEWLARRNDKIRQRDPFKLADDALSSVLKDAGLDAGDIHYIATTGDGESIQFSTGHFYSMTTHARGAIYLEPEARSLLDVGALHGRAVKMDERGKVLGYRMTSQCASGSGQFLENIARYLGIAQSEIGELSQQADDPEIVSTICAVLAETDVINMVSRGISAPNIIKGIHLAMAGRLAKLLRVIKASGGVTLVTGGLALDDGLIATLQENVGEQKIKVSVKSHPDSPYAGAIGAALWGAYRYEKLAAQGRFAKAS
jgi:benzoyl-CoA reductase subunit D